MAAPGPHYPLPYSGEGSVGLGKPLKMITHPLRADVPDLPRRRGSEERRARVRDRRRLGAALLVAVPHRRVHDARRGPRRLRDRRERVGGARRRRRQRAVADQGDARLLHRRHGREVAQLPHRAHGPHGLRGRGIQDPGPVLRGQARRGDHGRARRVRRRDLARRARRSASPSGSTPGAPRRSRRCSSATATPRRSACSPTLTQ